jgi:hypothetical protein
MTNWAKRKILRAQYNKSAHGQCGCYINLSCTEIIPPTIDKIIASFIVSHQSASRYVVHVMREENITTWMVGYVIPTTLSICYLRGYRETPNGQVIVVAYSKKERHQVMLGHARTLTDMESQMLMMYKEVHDHEEEIKCMIQKAQSIDDHTLINNAKHKLHVLLEQMNNVMHRIKALR